MTEMQDRIRQHSVPEPNGGCWLWTAATRRKGYGCIAVTISRGRNPIFMAHRVSYEAFVGPIPSGMLVCHRCDTPGCVNPDHLFLGTHADNTRDMRSKGRDRGLQKPRSTCIRGHSLLDPTNYRWRRTMRGTLWKQCRQCVRIRRANHLSATL